MLFLICILLMNAHANELEDSQELVSSLANNSKLHNLKFTNVIVVQGGEKKLPSSVYTIIDDQITHIIGKSNRHTVKHIERLPYLTVVGTPKSLKISNRNKKKLRDIAIKYDADAIFLWDLITFDNNLYFTARIVNVKSDKTLWTYQKDLKELRADQDALMRYDGPLETPLQSFIILSGSVDYIVGGYERNAFDTNNDINAEYMMGLSVEYLTSTTWDPRLSFGIHYALSSDIGSNLDVMTNQLLVDFRYQLNTYTSPIYDSGTGAVVSIRNKQRYSIGGLIGPSLMDIGDAKDNKVALAAKIYFNAAFTDNIEYNLGVSYVGKKTFVLTPDPTYTENVLDLGGVNVYMTVGYKFKLYKD